MPNGSSSRTGPTTTKLDISRQVTSSSSVPTNCEYFQHDFDFGDLSYGLEETVSSTPGANTSNRRVKAVRMNVHTLTSMLEDSIDIMLLPHWSKVNRIIFQVMGIAADGQLDLYPKTSKTVLQSPLTYLEILRQIRSRFGIEIYVGTPLVYASENLINRQHHRTIQDLLETNPEQFWSSLTFLVFKYGFDGIELNMEGLEFLSERLYDQLLDFQYRSKLLLIFKNNYGFVHHHGGLLKRLSELVESIIINAYGYFKYIPISGNLSNMVPKCECSVSDWYDTYKAYREHEISPSKLMMAIETSSVIYFLDSQNFNEVDCISFTPNKVVEQLRQDGEIYEDTRYAYSEHLDREKNGCILECRERGVVISYDNLRMKKLKFQICRNKGLRGCVIGNVLEDVSIHNPELNLLNLMAKYI